MADPEVHLLHGTARATLAVMPSGCFQQAMRRARSIAGRHQAHAHNLCDLRPNAAQGIFRSEFLTSHPPSAIGCQPPGRCGMIPACACVPLTW